MTDESIDTDPWWSAWIASSQAILRGRRDMIRAARDALNATPEARALREAEQRHLEAIRAVTDTERRWRQAEHDILASDIADTERSERFAQLHQITVLELWRRLAIEPPIE